MKYPIVLENSADGWIVAHCPTFRGCVSQGETRAEALENIREAIELTLEVYTESGWEVPEPAEWTELAVIEL